jgi:hypothetical protein
MYIHTYSDKIVSEQMLVKVEKVCHGRSMKKVKVDLSASGDNNFSDY